MFKKTMTFDNLDGEEVTETFYFNFNKLEIAELLEFGAIQKYADPDKSYLPLEDALEKLQTPTSESGLSEPENTRQAYNIFQDLILDAYGVKEADNVTFTKNKTLRERWQNHVAFVELIFEFIANPQLAAEFFEQCLPPKMVEKAKQELALQRGRKVSNETLMQMVQEADERQKDPATRIEPGLENAPEHIQQNGAALAEALELPTKRDEDLTPDDILAMDDEAFKKIDPQKLSQETMMAAFRRKSL